MCVCALIHAMIRLYFGVSSRERYLIWAHFESGHFHTRVSRFPLVFLRSWRTEVLPVLCELFRQDSFMSETPQSKCIQAVLASSMWGRDISSSKRDKNMLFHISMNVLSIRSWPRNPERAFVFSEMYHFRLLDRRTLSCYRLRYIQEKGWDFVNPERRKKWIRCCVSSPAKRNSTYSSTTYIIKQVNRIHPWSEVFPEYVEHVARHSHCNKISRVEKNGLVKSRRIYRSFREEAFIAVDYLLDILDGLSVWTRRSTVWAALICPGRISFSRIVIFPYD